MTPKLVYILPKRKLLVQNAIKMKEQNSKMKLFKDSCASSKAKSKGFWSFLKGKKCHDYPVHIVDPDNKNNILTEEIDIKISLQQHFTPRHSSLPIL